MTVAVTTPTGHVGSHVARMLCQAGLRPRLLVRNPGRLDASEVAVEGIVGMAAGKRQGFTPEQPRSVLTTTPSTLVGWAITHLRPLW